MKNSTPIITSLLDNDLYKLTMMQAVFHQFKDVEVEYEFKCRNAANLNVYSTEVKNQIEHYCSLTFTREELNYLCTLPYFSFDFINYLATYKTSYSYVQVSDYPFKIRIKGPWLNTILMEVPILAIVNEVFNQNTTYDYSSIINATITKFENEKLPLIKSKPDFKFSDFGTRRRFSKQLHNDIINCIKNSVPEYNFIGTSNVYFAKIFNLKPVGTMAHEWVQAGQAFTGDTLASQAYMLQKWADEYRGDLGIALTDTLGINKFLKDFDKYFAKLYDGVRQDSGDPFIVGRQIIDHYRNLGIDTKTKTIIFSDSLTFPKAIELYKHFYSEINTLFGIGTNLTNDTDCISPIPIVIKMIKCNGYPVAKISDTPEKEQSGDKEYIISLKKKLNIS